MTADSKQEHPAWRVGLFIGALALMGFGVQQILLGWHKRPLDVAGASTTQTMPESSASKQKVDSAYYLEFDGDSRRWVFRPTSGQMTKVLPAGIPEPPGFEVPSRAMSMSQWSQFFRTALASGKMAFSEKTLSELQRFSLDSKKPFANLGNATVKKENKEENSNVRVVEIPPEFNPKTSTFEQEMSAWQRSVRTALRASQVERQGYRVSSTHPVKGNQARLLFTSIARNRVLSRDFGRKRQDILIYLQVLCNFYDVELKIDGVTGPRTRQSIDAFAFLVLPEDKARAEYRQLLRPWIGS